MNRKVIILGVGGHGKVVADIVLKSGDQLLGFLDDNPAITQFLGFPVLGRCEDYVRLADAEFVIAIGNAAVRQKLANNMSGVRWYTAIHPCACISSLEVSIGEGSVVMPNAVVNAGAKIGDHCIVNTGGIVEHDSVLENFVHISVGAKLCGTVHVGESTWIGAGAVVRNNLSIGSHCMIGAGAVVVNDIVDAGTYVGVPARRLS